jgi:pimeloyl-ACP methyl ester carboxylesterase
MSKPAHIHLSDLRGLQRLASDATVGLTDLVEAMHHTVAGTPGIFGNSPGGRTAGITGLVYRSVRGITRTVGAGVDVLLGRLAPLLAERASSEEREAILAALNGVLGDYLVASGNPLAIAMQVRNAGMPVAIDKTALAGAFPDPERTLVLLVHGLCMNDRQWLRQGHDHGTALQRHVGCTPVYLHYNSGRHVSTNGRELADLVETLLQQWPRPVERLVIIGHSMGGLVARSAFHYATLAGHAWPDRLDDLIFLGTPHFGAPLERAGAGVDFLLGISPYTAPFARLGKLRSAGITDLRHGNLRDEDWLPAGPPSAREATTLPLPDRVRCHAVAASRQAPPLASAKTRSIPPAARIRGDGLVPVNSALGRHRDRSLDLAIPEARRWIGYRMGHLDLLSRVDVYAQIRHWLEAAPKSIRRR